MYGMWTFRYRHLVRNLQIFSCCAEQHQIMPGYSRSYRWQAWVPWTASLLKGTPSRTRHRGSITTATLRVELPFHSLASSRLCNPLMKRTRGPGEPRSVKHQFRRMDSRIYALMEQGNFEDVITLVEGGSEVDVYPHGSCLVDFLGMLGERGEVDAIMHMWDIVVNKKKVREGTYMLKLRNAFRKTGRVTEAIDLLKRLYFTKRDFDEVDLCFSLVTRMVLDYFPHRLKDIDEFIYRCKHLQIPGPSLLPMGHMWRCLMLTQRYREADEYYEKHKEDLEPMITTLTHSIYNPKREERKDVQLVPVLHQLLVTPYIPDKCKLPIKRQIIRFSYKSGEMLPKTKLRTRKKWIRMYSKVL